MPNIGLPELIIILVIILLLFGAKKLPELARTMGQAGKEFQDGMSGDKKSDEKKSTSKTKK